MSVAGQSEVLRPEIGRGWRKRPAQASLERGTRRSHSSIGTTGYKKVVDQWLATPYSMRLYMQVPSAHDFREIRAIH